MLPANHRTSVGRRLVRVAKEIVPVTAWLEWNVNCFLMSMYLYILSTYWYVLVCTKCSWKVERRHTGALDCGKWGWVCWISIWCYTSKRMLPDYLEPYMLLNQYIPVCTWYVLSTYQYVLESPKSFWGYYVFTFDNEKRYCVYRTGTWWCLKTKAAPDFMAIIHVIIPVHTEYIPVHTGTIFSITYQYVLGTVRYIPVCTKNPNFVPLVTIWNLARLRYRSHGLRYRSMDSYIRISLYRSPQTSISKHFILTSI